MNVRWTFVLALVMTANAHAADFATCATARLEDGADCEKTHAVFDFSKCEDQQKEMSVKATCWNGKRVAKTKVGHYKLTATFQEQSGWGKTSWQLASLKAEEGHAPKAASHAAAPVAVTPPPKEERAPAGITVPPAPPAAEPTKADESLKIGGLMDMYYVYNFNNPRPVTPPSSTSLGAPSGNNTYRAFDQYHDDINLGMAEINLTKTVGEVTGYAALDFGTTVDVLSANDESGKHVTEAKVTYKPNAVKGLSVTMGKMYTHLGLEVVKSKDNWNYSRSLLFTYAIPLWHEGVAISYPLVTDKLVATAYVYNKTASAYQNDRSKTLGAQLSSTPIDGLSLVYNYLSGPETDATAVDHVRTLHELNGSYAITKTLSAGFDVVKGSLTKTGAAAETGDWLAWSVAAKWQPGRFYLSPRYEVYEDTDGATMSLSGQRLTSETLTLGLDLGGGLETRFEFRQDESSQKSFTKGNEATAIDHQLTGTLGVLYNF